VFHNEFFIAFIFNKNKRHSKLIMKHGTCQNFQTRQIFICICRTWSPKKDSIIIYTFPQNSCSCCILKYWKKIGPYDNWHKSLIIILLLENHYIKHQIRSPHHIIERVLSHSYPRLTFSIASSCKTFSKLILSSSKT